ncbi:MAG: flagellar motor switch protein FliM [Actinobacteria bacterium]|nr:flagellar motor switch protein FliM [Actinomycetota bacterium]
MNIKAYTGIDDKEAKDNPENFKVFTIKRHSPILDDTGEHLNIRLFDFRRPAKFAKDQIRIMEIVHDSFSRIAETHISIQTRTVTEINCSMVEQKSFGEYLNSLSERSYINILTSPLLDGDTILHFKREAVFMIIDRVLGGKGFEEIDRDFTEIERNLMNSIVKDFLYSLKEAWVNIADLNLNIKRVESNPQFARVVASNEMCLVLNFGIMVGNKKSYFSFCLPFLSIKPILEKISTRSWFAYGKTIKNSDGKKNILSNMNKVNLAASVVLGKASATLKEIQSIEKGDIIKLDSKKTRLIDLVIGDRTIFKVQPGKRSNNLAVQVVKVNQ